MILKSYFITHLLLLHQEHLLLFSSIWAANNWSSGNRRRKIITVLDACTALPAGSLNGFIGLAERGSCDFNVKVENMQNVGAIGAIIYNAPSSIGSGNMGGTNLAFLLCQNLLIMQKENILNLN
ncbi:PA domain-containing protein [Chryseobacterium wanjuense]